MKCPICFKKICIEGSIWICPSCGWLYDVDYISSNEEDEMTDEDRMYYELYGIKYEIDEY